MRTAADLDETIRPLVERGREAWRAREYEHARLLFEEALRLAQARGDLFGQMTAHHFLGNVAFNECRDQESRIHHLHALNLAEADGDPQGIATSLGSLALVEVAEGDFEAARAKYDACIAAYVEAEMRDAAEQVRETAHRLLDDRVPINTLVHRTCPPPSG